LIVDRLAPASPYRDRLLQRINEQYARVLDAGMALADYPGETIQCRNELDRTNWLGLKDICEEAVALDAGELLIPEPGIRCTSNVFIRPTYAYTLDLMRAVRNYALAAQANWWRLKDLAKTASSLDQLHSIDLEAGWP
jgi:hypothetical protein